MEEWYYWSDGKQAGPVEQSRLVQLISTGKVTSEDPVWRGGMADWLPAGSVPELRLPVAPPPGNVMPPAAISPSPAQPSTGAGGAARYYSPPPQSLDALPPSGLGFASFVIAIVVIVMEVMCIGSVIFMEMPHKSLLSPTPMSAPAGVVRNSGSPAAGMVIAGLGMFGGIFLALIGAGLGVGRFFQKRKRVFGVLGTVINGGILLLALIIMAIGLMA